MNTNTSIRNNIICRVVLGLVTMGQTLQFSHATDISDTPMAVKTSAKANIMFMIDNSGSMNNIVPDSPYSTSLTAANCTGSNRIPAGTTVDIRLTNTTGTGEPRIRYSSTNYEWGTSGSNKCFISGSMYPARLYADDGDRPGSYLDAEYTGHFLNWYFNKNNTSPTWSSSQSKKPGTYTRMEVARPAAKNAADLLSRGRIGLSAYNSSDGGSLLMQMTDIDDTAIATFKAKVDTLSPSGSTPLAETLSDLGKYFATGYTGDLRLYPGQTCPVADCTISVDNVFSAANGTAHSIQNNTGETLRNPIEYACQKSFVMLMTDGRPQYDRNISTYIRDYTRDCAGGACYSNSNGTDLPSTAISSSDIDNYENGVKAGRVYEQQGSDYLDDVAAALYDIDLRPNITKSSSTQKNNVHTYTIGFADTTVASDPLLSDTATEGGGSFLSASDSTALAAAFEDALNDIASKDGSAAAVAVANANVADDNASYASTYHSGTWTGDLNAYAINTTTGQPSSTPSWTSSAQTRLTTLMNNGTASANRKIVTYSGSAGVQFQPSSATTTTKLSTTQEALLNSPSSTDAESVIAYLRGTENSTYRSRSGLLGDIVNAEPVVLNKPMANYTDIGYSTYKTNNASRTKMVFQGANDGMLHAFNASTNALGGTEEWAYIPSLLLGTLNERARKTGFNHKYYVDGTPVINDVDFYNTDSTTATVNDWRTILVGGLGKGGRGYYALDVTNPVPTSEANATTKVLWEFPNDSNKNTNVDIPGNTTLTYSEIMGYSMGKPIIAKTAAYGWVVLVTSGYNNGTDTGGDGQGYLIVLNPRNGNVLKVIATGTSDQSADPVGLAHISAYVESPDTDATVDYVYGGDLKGNVWRFDLSSLTPSSWTVTKLATLVDGASPATVQPITTAPELGKIEVNGSYKRMVYVGTGQYLGDSDIPGVTGANVHASQTQTMYGLVDDKTATPLINPLRSSLQQQTLSLVSGSTNRRVVSSNTIDWTTKKGWYIDLPTTGERINTDPALGVQVLAFVSNIPSNDACTPGGSGWLTFVDYKTGGFVANAGLTYSSISLGNTLGSRPVLIKLPSGAIRALVRKSDATTETIQIPTPATSGVMSRISWRELPDQ